MIQTGQGAHANERSMVEQAVEHCHAVAEVSLKQRHERAAVPRSEREYTDASSTVTADPIVRETRTVGLLVEVVRLGQLGQKPAAIADKRAAR